MSSLRELQGDRAPEEGSGHGDLDRTAGLLELLRPRESHQPGILHDMSRNICSIFC